MQHGGRADTAWLRLHGDYRRISGDCIRTKVKQTKVPTREGSWHLRHCSRLSESASPRSPFGGAFRVPYFVACMAQNAADGRPRQHSPVSSTHVRTICACLAGRRGEVESGPNAFAAVARPSSRSFWFQPCAETCALSPMRVSCQYSPWHFWQG